MRRTHSFIFQLSSWRWLVLVSSSNQSRLIFISKLWQKLHRENNKSPEEQNETEEVEERELTEEDIADLNAIKMRLANLEEEYGTHINQEVIGYDDYI